MQYKYYSNDSNNSFLQYWTDLLTKIESLDFQDKDKYVSNYKQCLEHIKKVPFVEWKGIKYEVNKLRETLREIIKLHGYKDEIDCCKCWFDKIKPYYGAPRGISITWMFAGTIEKEVFTNYYNSQYNRYISIEHKDKIYMSTIEYLSFVCLEVETNNYGFFSIQF